jgi:hypothetical protein
MVLSIGQGSGDFAETSGRVQAFHIGFRNSVGILAPDGFTQANPPVVTTNVSATLAGITQVGVLGGSVAFTRPDAGNGFIGGPTTGTADDTLIKPLGIFINDANGNALENTPGVASGRAPYFSGQGCFGFSVYETEDLGGGGALTWSAGDVVVASRNGLLTNVDDQTNGYESSEAGADGSGTVLGVVKIAPDADNSLLVIDLRV